MTKRFLWPTQAASLIAFFCIAQAGAAQNLIAHSLRFEDVERRFADSGRLSEAQATALAAIPIGSAAGEAQATLEKAGARCAPQWHRPQNMLCIYRQRTTADDYYQADIVWTATLQIQAAKVATLSLDRDIDKH